MLQRLVNVLDGKPRGSKGQSFVEMTLTLPVLILMVLSLVEIGFVANNFLILMDLVRESGRRGANLNPVAWDEGDTRNFERMDCDKTKGLFNLAQDHPQMRQVPRGWGVLDLAPYNYYKGDDKSLGFFDSVICQAILSFTPLNFESSSKWGAGGTTEPEDSYITAPNGDKQYLFAKNDIVVSAIAYARMDYNKTASLLPPGGTVNSGNKLPPNKQWITVTGRYPLRNRYCGAGSGSTRTGDTRDPFDFKRTEFYSNWTNGSAPDAGEQIGTANDYSGLYDETASQGIRGFVFTGAAINADGCRGSRFTVQEIEQRLNMSAGAYDSSKYTPNGGMVIVEMFWQHHPLFLGPIFEGLTGNPENDPVLYIYGIFPTGSAEPTATPG